MKQLVQSLLRPFGLRLARLSTRPPDYGGTVFLSTLKRFGFSPSLIFDVGANHGYWTRTAVSFFPAAQFYLFEPQDHLKTNIQDLVDFGADIHWINIGLGDQSGVLHFSISDRDDSSTFLPREDQPQTRVTSETMVAVETLDAVLEKYQLPVPQLVKIDAEGFDLKVMRGASRLIGKTDIFLIEAAVLCPFENSVANVVRAMDDFGYRLMDITELNRSPKHGVLWLSELAFLRKASPLLAVCTSYE